MSDWTINLTFVEGSSNKFWRGKTDGTKMYVNFGRIGSDGQTKVKEFKSEAEAKAGLDKVANEKRKKGYVDRGGGPADDEGAEAVAEEIAGQEARMTMTRDGRPVVLSLKSDGAVVTTEVVETHADAAAAAAAFQRIVEAMIAEGYRREA